MRGKSFILGQQCRQSQSRTPVPYIWWLCWTYSQSWGSSFPQNGHPRIEQWAKIFLVPCEQARSNTGEPEVLLEVHMSGVKPTHRPAAHDGNLALLWWHNDNRLVYERPRIPRMGVLVSLMFRCRWASSTVCTCGLGANVRGGLVG